jgi:plastocyanin
MSVNILLRLAGAPSLLLAFGLLTGCSHSAPPEAKKVDSQPPAAKPVVYFKVDPATAGTLSGKVQFSGKKPKRKRIDMSEDPQCAAAHKNGMYDESVVVNPNNTLANVFVYIKQGLEGKTFEPPAEPVTIDQKGCWFHPRVLGIQTGQILNVTNSDPVTHNIHPLAQVNRAWNQSQDPGATPLKRRFATPEIMIRVKCNIHSWMRAWIGVVDNPYFAVTGPDGKFEIKNVPPGDYTVEAWQEQLGTSTQKVTVPPSGKEAVAFTFKGE